MATKSQLLVVQKRVKPGLRGDLWKFDTGSYAWDLISVDGPSARAHHVAIWDTMNQALWIHGGFDGMACQDLWRFETLSSTWNSVAQSGPSPRFDHVAVWDPIRLAILIHGGYDQGLHRDLWKFEVPVLTTTTTNTQTTTTSSQTSTTTTSTTSSTILASDISNEGLPSDVLALILALSVIGVLACCCVFQWYRQRQKNREAVVPVPPPLPPPLPPPPPSPKSPQLRVNMQVLVPPPSPQQPPPKPQRTRVAAFSHKDPLYFPDVATLAARRHQSCCESCSSCADIVPVVEQSPLMPEHVCLDILMPPAQPQDVHMAVPSKRTKAELCKPKEPGRTEKAPELPNSTEHAAGHQHRRPLVPGRLQTLADPQPPAPESFGRPKSMNAPVLPESCFRPGRDTEAKARANTAMTTAATPVTSPGHIDVVIELPVQSPQVPRVTSSGSQSPRPKGHPGLRPKSHRPKVPSRTEAAPELPSAGSPGPLGPATLGCPAAPAARFAPIEPLEIAVVLPREAVHHVPQPELDVKRPKCPKRPQLPMATHRPLEVAVEIGPWPPQPPQPPRPAAHQLPWPHFRRRLQRSQSAQTPRRWTKGPKAPKARPRPKSAKPKGRGQPTSTLGGPWWKGYPGYPQIATDLQWKSRDRGDWAVLNENPGPGAYDLEHPRIQGRIPGRVPGYPHVPRDPDKRLWERRLLCRCTERSPMRNIVKTIQNGSKRKDKTQ